MHPSSVLVDLRKCERGRGGWMSLLRSFCVPFSFSVLSSILAEFYFKRTSKMLGLDNLLRGKITPQNGSWYDYMHNPIINGF